MKDMKDMKSEGQVEIKKESSSTNMQHCSNGDYYPYGTSLTVCDDVAEDLNFESLAVGDIVKVHGYAFVDRKSEVNTKEKVTKEMCLQMTSMKVMREADDHAVQLYGSSSNDK